MEAGGWEAERDTKEADQTRKQPLESGKARRAIFLRASRKNIALLNHFGLLTSTVLR